MYKILKRGYYYGNAHEPEEEFLPTSYPTEEMAHMAVQKHRKQYRGAIPFQDCWYRNCPVHKVKS